MTNSIHHQTAIGKRKLLDRINALLCADGLERVRFSVAYVRWDGLGLISTALEEFLKRGGKFEAVYGAGNGVTTSDALYYGLLLRKRFPGKTYAGFIEDKYANSIFHPKYFEFRFTSKVKTLIGSANLTGGGLARNEELIVETDFALATDAESQLLKFWESVRKSSTKVTAARITKLANASNAGSEGKDESGGTNAGKPFLKSKAKATPKPLFHKVLNLPELKNKKKRELLASMTALTDRPSKLYLQIFEKETGGSKGKSGSMVQLPVETLSTYFGMSKVDSRPLTIHFPTEKIVERVIHNSNATHQIRINPIFPVKRPAIIKFQRIAKDEYKASFIPASRYEKTIISKCLEQTRSGSRKWGLWK